jgi:ribokinase
MLAAFGNDAFAAPIETSLSGAGVQLHQVRVRDLPTGTAFICVSDDAENAITVAPGANAALLPQHLPPLAGFTYLLLQLETPVSTVTSYAESARGQGVKVVLNAAPAQALDDDLLKNVDVLVVNQGELSVLTNHQGTIAQCLERIDVPTVVVTLGHHGCIARDHGQFILQAAFDIKPVDTTAAGDTFCGALVAAMASGAGMAHALRIASAAGALACTKPGAQSSIPHAAEVAAFLAQQPDMQHAAMAPLRAFCGLHESFTT